jgi:myo-inositol-1(or 4)-monophosphatase
MLHAAITVARQAGSLLLEGLDHTPAIELKSPYEVVTDIDRASEQLIVTTLVEQFPDHAILAEEGGGIERTSDYLWVIDPLDGTNNYAHGFPFFSVSIGLLRHGSLFLGVVYDPVRDQMFTAQAGSGAFCNGRRMSVSQTATVAASLLSTGFPYDYGITSENNREQFDRLQSCSQGVRRAGSAALDLAYVASGRFDAHWEFRLKPWDSAAGALLIQEAGGRLTDFQNQTWTPWSQTVIASNAHIHDELLAIIGGIGTANHL